jgi:hypothetical protein
MELNCYVQMVNFFFGLGPHLINHNAAVIKNNESSCQVPVIFLLQGWSMKPENFKTLKKIDT